MFVLKLGEGMCYSITLVFHHRKQRSNIPQINKKSNVLFQALIKAYNYYIYMHKNPKA